MRSRATLLLGICVAICFFPSCKKQGVKPVELPTADTSFTKVLVLCEGNFLWNNADLDLYNRKTGQVIHGIFQKQNQGKKLGDVLQSGLFSNNSLWLVLNNSGKMVALDPTNFTYKSEVGNLGSPRYACYHSDRFWLTDIYSNSVHMLNQNRTAVEENISCNGWTEQIAAVGNNLYITNYDYGLYVLNPANKKMVDSVKLKRGTQWFVVDTFQNAWALASDSGKSYLYQINLSNHQVIREFKIPGSSGAMRLSLTKNKDSVLFISEGVWCHGVKGTVLPSAPVFQKSGATFYGLGMDPWTGEIYVADAKDFVSKGTVYRITSGGAELGSFASGIIPGGFLFYR